MRKLLLPALLAALPAACSGVERDISQLFLTPTFEDIAGPSDLGLDFENVEIEITGDITLRGWFIPSPGAAGRTVVLLHGNTANISYYHPYYSFLHDAGFNVFLYDYRGYGKSTGELSINGLFFDLRQVVAYLGDRDDVDRDKVAWYGISLGSVLAMHVAARYPSTCCGIVVEDLISPRKALARELEESGGNVSSVQVYFLETFHLASNTEPLDNAANVEDPVLMIEGDLETQDYFAESMATYHNTPAELRSLWIQPQTSHAPHSLLVHDREYQTAVSSFLAGCFAGNPERVTIDWRQRSIAGGDQMQVVATLGRAGSSADEPWPVQVCVIDEDEGRAYFNVWLTEKEQEFLFASGKPVEHVSAWRYRYVSGTPGQDWRADPGALARSERILADLQPVLEPLVEKPEDAVAAVLVAEFVASMEQEVSFHPLLEAQLADVWLRLGKAFLSSDPERARVWLQRCVNARPTVPKLHYWPGRPYVAGFPHQAAVDEAQRLLTEN